MLTIILVAAVKVLGADELSGGFFLMTLVGDYFIIMQILEVIL